MSISGSEGTGLGSELTATGSVLTAAEPPSSGGGGGGQNTLAPLSGDGSVANPIQIAPATTSTPGSMSAAQVTKLNALLRPVNGTNLGNTNTTVDPATDKVSQYVIPPATLTGNRIVTLGASTLVGLFVRIVREDLTANTVTINNGGTHGAAFPLIFTASPSKITAMSYVWNGVDWVFVGFEYLQVT